MSSLWMIRPPNDDGMHNMVPHEMVPNMQVAQPVSGFIPLIHLSSKSLIDMA